MTLQTGMQSSDLSVLTAHILTIAVTQVNFLTSSVKNALDFRKIDVKDFSVHYDYFNFNQVFSFVSEIFNQQLTLNGNTLIMFQDQTNNLMPQILHGDQARLKQVLINLLKEIIMSVKETQVSVQPNYDSTDQLLRCEIVIHDHEKCGSQLLNILKFFQLTDDARNVSSQDM